MSNWHFTSPAMTRRIWLLWKYRFLAVVRCQAVWALALPLDYISDVDLWLGESGCRGNTVFQLWWGVKLYGLSPIPWVTSVTWTGGPAAWATACLPYHRCPDLRSGEDPPVPLQSDHSETSPQWESLYQIHLTGSHSSGSRSRCCFFTLIWTKKEWVNEQLLVRLMKQNRSREMYSLNDEIQGNRSVFDTKLSSWGVRRQTGNNHLLLLCFLLLLYYLSS